MGIALAAERGSLFGIAVRSHRRLPDLHDAPGDASSALILRFTGAAPAAPEGRLHHSSCKVHGDGLRVFACPDGSWELWFLDGTWARIDAALTAIDAWTPAGSTFEDTLSYLYGPVIGFLVRLRGTLALHASVALFGGAAVAFVGQSGAGKSTVAAALALGGHTVLSEDLVAIGAGADGRATVHAGYRYLRLWADSAALVNAGLLPPVTPTWPKLRLSLGGAPASAPLALVYLLGDPCAEPAGASTAVAPGQAVIALMRDSYLQHLLPPAERARELGAIGALAREVPVRRLRGPALPHGIAAFRHLIERDLGRLARAAT